MATVNYSWNLPTVGGSEDTWGTSLNANWTDLDTLLGGVSQTEFAILDGATVSTAELNLLDGVTWTLTDYNTLTATATELNLLDGVTATTAELNILDGVTATAAEINQLDADSTGALKVPTGTVAQRPSPAQGQIRFNSDDSTFEGYDGTAWSGLGGGGETMFLTEEQTSGTNGGASSVGWNTRLNTLVHNGITGASFSTPTITLPAGTYEVQALAANGAAPQHKLRMYDIDNTASLADGLGVSRTASGEKDYQAPGFMRFTLAGETDVRLEHYHSAANATFGLGLALSQGTEIYAQCIIKKVA